MSQTLYLALCGVCTVAVLIGINCMSKVKSAVFGNALSALAVLAAMVLTLVRYGVYSSAALYASLALGLVVGVVYARRTEMIAMPQVVALLNGLGGAASALVAGASVINGTHGVFENATSGIALAIGALTLTGSLIAAGKLARVIDSKPKVLPAHGLITVLLTVLTAAAIVLQVLGSGLWAVAVAVLALVGGVIFVMRVGGADMPITISLLNSLSGVAGGIAGMAVNEPLLVAVGGIVGASGLILTQDMCKAMNRSLGAILTGKTTVAAGTASGAGAMAAAAASSGAAQGKKVSFDDIAAKLRSAKKVIIVPGYGMALSQAQKEVADFAAKLEKNGAEVKFAIHPVAGRMPGHMSVLLAEVDIPYEKLCMMDDINPEFASCDIAVVVGANDVTNPAANTAEGTPIYGMPVLRVAEAPVTVICNFDTKPGYAGVPNPMYSANNALLLLGDAKVSVAKLSACIPG